MVRRPTTTKVIRIEINRPFNPVFVAEHSKIGTPQAFVNRHFNFTILRKSIERAVGFFFLSGLRAVLLLWSCLFVLFASSPAGDDAGQFDAGHVNAGYERLREVV